MIFAAFDLEITMPEDIVEFTPDINIWESGPFHITCAAIYVSDTHVTELFYGGKVHDTYEPYMSQIEAAEVLFRLGELANEGYKLVTWNGTGFDWRVLAQETGYHNHCAALALEGVDPMLIFHAFRGFPIGLAATAAGFQMPGKTEVGADTPAMWEAGEYPRVLEYVAQDVQLTAEVVRRIGTARQFQWVTKAGRTSYQPLARWYTSRQVLGLPLPSIGWMDDPITRASFYEWMEGE